MSVHPLLQQINRKKMSSQIFTELQNFFDKSHFKPGDKLPCERDLASALGVSRNSLREAFRVFEILGLIEIIPGSGTYIKNTNEKIITPLAMALSVENNSIEELLEIRILLECSVSSMAAERRDENDLVQIKNTLVCMEKSYPDLKSWIKYDTRFHFLVAQATKNSLLTRLYNTMIDVILESITATVNNRITSEKQALKTFKEHVIIYECIKDQNKKLAYEFMQKHLSDACQEIISKARLKNEKT